MKNFCQLVFGIMNGVQSDLVFIPAMQKPHLSQFESQDQLCKQVESGVAPAWVEWKPAPTPPALSGEV